jgi:hypothetical protein
MNIYLLILLRLTHVVAGILWGGAAVAYLFFVKPSVGSIGPAGPQFMQNLMDRRKYPVYMMVTSTLTVLSGGVLYWLSSGGLNLAWVRTGPGLGFTIGSLAALVAFLAGSFGIGPTSEAMAVLGGQIARSGAGPTPEQISTMQALEKKLVAAENLDFIMLAISMLSMAVSRYLIF